MSELSNFYGNFDQLGEYIIIQYINKRGYCNLTQFHVKELNYPLKVTTISPNRDQIKLELSVQSCQMDTHLVKVID